MGRYFTKQAARSSRVTDDDVVAATGFDDNKLVRDVIMRWVWVVDDVLDAAMLQESFNTLLCTGNWRRLAGRYRLNVRVRSF